MIEVIPYSGAFRQERFVVRGQRFLPLAQAAALRPSYDEYPTREGLYIPFPGAGRRGPSPVTPAQGQAPATQAPAKSPYPAQRDRQGADVPTGGALPSGDSPLASPVNACTQGGGIHMQVAQLVTAGTTDRKVSTKFTRPAVIRYMAAVADTFDVNTSRIQVRIVQTDNVAAAADGDGVAVDEGAIGLADFGVVNNKCESFPNKRWTNVPFWIKIIMVNGSAGNIGYQVIINLEWLD